VGVRWLFYVIDDPLEGNDAHAEIRAHREGRRPPGRHEPAEKPNKPALRILIKDVLSECFTIVFPAANLDPPRPPE
jgi:hypothetical protein